MKAKKGKIKTTFTYTEDLLETVQCISTISNKNKNEVIEEAFWDWWKLQESQTKYKVETMKEIMKK